MEEDLVPPIKPSQRLVGEKQYVYLDYISGFPSVAILVTNDDKVLLLKISRPLFGEGTQLEIPRGFGESNNPLNEAKRELLEETGISEIDLLPIGKVRADSGVLNAETYLFWGSTNQSVLTVNPKESISSYEWVEIDNVKDLILSGAISDSYTICALSFLELRNPLDVRLDDAQNPLYEFFLSDTMDNMRHTEGKQLQLAIGTIGAFAVVVATVIEKTSANSLFELNLRNLVATIALSVWSIAATTKLMRYRAWKEHYVKKSRELAGKYYTSSAPVIYAPNSNKKQSLRDFYKRRLFGDETLTFICLLLTIISNAFLASVVMRAIIDAHMALAWKISLSTLTMGASFLILERLFRALRFTIDEPLIEIPS